MKDTILTIVVILGIFIALPMLILWLRDKLFYPKLSPEEIELHKRKFEERLRSPNLDALQAHFSHALPAALRELYGNLDLLMQSDIEVLPPDGSEPVYICFFNPADAANLHSPWPGCEKYFAFADDGAGNELLVDPRLNDPPVLWHDHETGEIKAVAPSMSEFMRWKRQPVEE